MRQTSHSTDLASEQVVKSAHSPRAVSRSQTKTSWMRAPSHKRVRPDGDHYRISPRPITSIRCHRYVQHRAQIERGPRDASIADPNFVAEWLSIRRGRWFQSKLILLSI